MNEQKNLVHTPAHSRGVLHHMRRHYHHHYRLRFPKHAFKIFIFDTTLVIAIFVLGGLAAYLFLQRPLPHYLELTSRARSASVIVGKNTAWDLELKNNNEGELHDITTQFFIPSTFTVLENESPASAAPVWHIALLPRAQTLNYTLRGRIMNPVNEPIKIIARTTYFTKTNAFVTEANAFTLAATDPAFAFSLNTPAHVYAGQTFPLALSYRNRSDVTLDANELHFVLPASFDIVSKPSAWQGETLALGALAPGQAKTTELSGVLRADPHTPLSGISLHADTFVRGALVDQNDLLQNIAIAPIGLHIILMSAAAHTAPGGILPLTVSFSHEGGEDLRDVHICLPLSASIFDIAKLQGNGAFNDGKYCFTSSASSSLALIKPHDQGAFDVTAPLASTIDPHAFETTKNAVITLAPSAQLYIDPLSKEPLRIDGAPLSIPVTTVLNIEAHARYFTDDGEQLGRGPLPPEAGMTTKYWIEWSLNSSTNAIAHVQFKAHVPDGVVWTGKSTVSAGPPIQFDSITRDITWILDKLAPPGEEGCGCGSGGFELAITPAERDVNTMPTLLQHITAEATDEWTGQSVRAGISDITTDLRADPMAENKGVVRGP